MRIPFLTRLLEIKEKQLQIEKLKLDLLMTICENTKRKPNKLFNELLDDIAQEIETI